MPPARVVGQVTGSAVTAASLVVPYDSGGGASRALDLFIVHGGSILDTPVQTAVYGADSGNFLASVSTGLLTATIEVWRIAPVTESSSSIAITFAGGTSTTILLWAVEVEDFGRHGPGADTPAYNSVTAGTAFTVDDGLGTPDYTAVDSTGAGLTGTMTVPATDALIMSMGIIASDLGTIASTTGIDDGTVNAGGVGTRIAAAMQHQQATGGLDLCSYSVGTAPFFFGSGDPAAGIIVAELGATRPGILKSGSVLPLPV